MDWAVSKFIIFIFLLCMIPLYATLGSKDVHEKGRKEDEP